MLPPQWWYFFYRFQSCCILVLLAVRFGSWFHNWNLEYHLVITNPIGITVRFIKIRARDITSSPRRCAKSAYCDGQPSESHRSRHIRLFVWRDCDISSAFWLFWIALYTTTNAFQWGNKHQAMKNYFEFCIEIVKELLKAPRILWSEIYWTLSQLNARSATNWLRWQWERH